MERPSRHGATFGLLQKRGDCFERNSDEDIYNDVQSFIDETVAFIALLVEAMAFTFRSLTNCILALHRAVPAQKSIRSRNLFAGNAARLGFSARAGPHRYSLAQAILPIGLPAAGGRRIGRWTCRRAAQPAGRADAAGLSLIHI